MKINLQNWRNSFRSRRKDQSRRARRDIQATLRGERLEDRRLLAAGGLDLTAVGYDSLGNVAIVRDAIGQETSFERDDLGRVVAVQGPEPSEFVNYDYDANGNVLSMQDAKGHTFYEYDSFDRLQSVTKSTDATRGNADDLVVGYTYDVAGNIDTLTYPDGTLIDYDYDAVNRLSQVTQGADVTSYTYFVDGQLETATLPNGVTATYAYDSAGRLEDLVYEQSGGQLVTSFHYVFDAKSNRTSMEVRRPNEVTPDPNDFVSELNGYTYDARNQLTQVVYPDGEVVGYTYDGVGNRLTMTTDPDGDGAQPAEVLTYHYGLENRLTHTTNASLAVVDQFEYDARGNLISKTTPTGTTSYEYDYRNLPVQVVTPMTTIAYEYDGNGDRVARVENGNRVNYTNDVNRPYTQVLQTHDGASVLASHVFGIGRVSTEQASASAYFVTDALGSTSEVLDASAGTLNSYRYDAFGLPTLLTEGVANEFLFTGESYEQATGLTHLRARAYDVETGRFTSRDPSGFVDGPNQYGYVSSNPTNLVDPTGRWGVELGIGIVTSPFVGAWEFGSSVGDSLSQGHDLFSSHTMRHGAHAYARGTLSTAVGGLAAELTPGISLPGKVGKLIGGLPSDVTSNVASEWMATRIDQNAGMDSQFSWQGVAEDTAIGLLNPAGLVGVEQVGRRIETPSNRYWKNFVRQSGADLINDVVGDGARQIYDGLHESAMDLGNHFGAWFGRGHHSAPAYEPGGVLLDQAAQLIGDLTSITGATVDPQTNQVVLLGEDAANVPDLVLDDFVAAMRGVFGSTEPLGVTIDQPLSGDPNDPQTVEIFAGLEDTHLGYVFFEADRVMKMLALGVDNIAGQPVSSSVAGYKSMSQRWTDSYDPNANNDFDVRFFFKISDMNLVRSDDGKSFVFNDVGIELVAEEPAGGPSTDPDAIAFAQWFTDNFDAIAAEAYQYPSLADLTHPLLRLKQGAQAAAFARFLQDNDIDVDFSWLDNYQLEFVDTPETTPTGSVTLVAAGNAQITFSGGIDLAEGNTYLADIGGNVQQTGGDARQTRPRTLEQGWMLSDGTTKAVALAVDSTALNGNIVFAETDLVWATVGANSLAVNRFYNSLEPVDGPFGYGWEVLPSELTFTRPQLVDSGATLDGLREGQVRFVDRVSGQALTFDSSLQVDHATGQASGLTSGLPTYTPAGLFDGSTLTISNDRTQYTLTRPDGSTQAFGDDGRLLETADRNGNSITYGYTSDQLTTISDATGIVFTFTYNVDGRVGRVDGPSAERVDYVYDAQGDLISATRVRGNLSSSYEYDAGHRMTSATGADGLNRLGATSDALNRSDSRTDRRGSLAEFDFSVNELGTESTTTVEDVFSGITSSTQLDVNNRPTQVIDGLGRVTTFDYDPGTANRNPTAIQLPDLSRPEIAIAYDSVGNISSIFDPANDPDGNGFSHQFFYDGNQNLIRHIDGREIETTFDYDADNNLTKVARDGAEYDYTYYSNGLLETTSDPLDQTTTYFYDASGNLTLVRDAVNAETEYAYDPLNRLISVTDPRDRVVSYTYNDFDQITRIDAPQGFMTYEYDAVSKRLSRQTDFENNATDYTYDSITGDLIGLSIGTATVEYEYDRFGNLTSLVDAEGTRTVFQYDELNRPVVVSTSLESIAEQLRGTEQPWSVVQNTLVIAGSDDPASGDTILLDEVGSNLTLIINLESFVIDATGIDAIQVYAGDGDDLVDLRAATSDMIVSMFGEEGSDILLAGEANDFVSGGAGSDWLEGGAGNDFVFGGKDADVLFSHESGPSSLFAMDAETRDHVLGEDGADLLFSRSQDGVLGGAGDNQYFGIQADGSFNSWSIADVPLGLTGRILLIGDSGSNNIVIKQVGDQILFVIDGHTRVISNAAFDFVTGLFSEILVLTAGSSDSLDAKNSPVPVLFVGGPGDDVGVGSAFSDRLIGGPGGDTLIGRTGDDRLLDGSGADDLDGGDGADIVRGSDDGAVDTLRGGSVKAKIFVPGPTDQTVSNNENDTIVQPGDALPRGIANPAPSWLGFSDYDPSFSTPRQTNPVIRSASPSQTRRSARPISSRPTNEITEFSVSNSVVTQGDSVLFTVRLNPDADQWGRLRILADPIGNGIHGVELARSRGRDLNWRSQISTRQFAAGTVSVIAEIEMYNGTRIYSDAIELQILEESVLPTPPLLPSSISIDPSNVNSLLPRRNGNLTVTGNPLAQSQIDIWEITSRETGGFQIQISGLPVIVAWYDENGQIISLPDDDGEGTVTIPQGKSYYFAVTGQDGVGGTYDLAMTGRNQTVTATIAVPANTYAGTATAEITADQRLHYFRLDAPNSATLLDVDIDVEAGLNVWVRVDDDAGNILGYAEFSRAGRDQLLTDLPVQGGTTYWVVVLGQQDTFGQVTVNGDFYPDQIGFDPHINPATPLANYTQITVQADGDAVLQNQQANGQINWYLLAPTNGGLYILRTTGATDVQMAVYPGNGAEILAESDNDGAGTNAQVTIDLVGGVEYWIAVRGTGSATGPFELQLIGPDQILDVIPIGGLGQTGGDGFSLGFTNDRQEHFSFVAPENAVSADIQVVGESTTNLMDTFFSIENSSTGEITVFDTPGLNVADVANAFPLTPGVTYWLTVTDSTREAGFGSISIDVSPDANTEAEFLVNTTSNNSQRDPNVAMNAAGRTVVVWTGFVGGALDTDIVYQVFDEAGQPVGGERIANMPNGSVDQSDADVGIAADGSFVLTWRENATSEIIYARRFAANGNPIGNPFDLGFTQTTFASPSLAVHDDGSFAVVNRFQKQLHLKTFNATGSATSGIQILEDHTKDVLQPAIATHVSGGYVLSYVREDAEYLIYAKRISSAGVQIGSTITVDGSGENQFTPVIDSNASGQFVVAFNARQNGSADHDSYFKVYDSSGASISALKRANVTLAENQQNPDVALKDDGSVIVVWESEDQDGKGVFYRQYDTALNPVSFVDTQLNGFTAGEQRYIKIGASGGDDFFTTWQSEGHDSTIWDSVVGLALELPTPPAQPRILVEESSGTANDNIVEFGTIQHNTSASSQFVTIRNVGTDNLIGTLSLSGANAARFTLVGSSSLSIAPGAQRIVELQMASSIRGTFVAEFVVTHNATSSPNSIVLNGVVVPATDAYEQNDSLQDATNLGTIAISDSLSVPNLSFHQLADKDWFEFQVAAFSTALIDLTFGHQEGDLDAILFDSNGGIVGASATVSDNESINANLSPNESYFLYVFSLGDAANIYGMTIQTTLASTAPTNVFLSIQSLDENTDTSGGTTAVADLSASDPDVGETFTFDLVAGIGDADNDAFVISGNQLLAKQGLILNHELKDRYSIRIRATDTSGLSIEKSFSIDIADTNEAPTGISISATSLVETAEVGTLVATLSATDPDSGDLLSFSKFADPDGKFEVSGSELRLAAAVDFENTTSHTVTIRTTDIAGLSFDKQFTINVVADDQPPQVTGSNESSLSRGESVALSVVGLEATDVDSDDDSLVFVIKTLPANGMLLSSGTPLDAGDTFTRSNVAAGVIVYSHNGTSTTSDSFTYTARDLDHNESPFATFNFTVLAPPSVGLVSLITIGGTDIEDGRAVATDSDGNSYVTGYFKGTTDFDLGPGQAIGTTSDNSRDIFVAKYLPSGNLDWVRTYGGTSTDHGQDIALDDAGNIYVTGYFGSSIDFGGHSRTSQGNRDIFAVKLNNSGDVQWVYTAGGTGLDSGRGISVDTAGNVFVGGEFNGIASFGGGQSRTATLSDGYLLKLNTSGSLDWVRQMGGSNEDVVYSVAIDDSGNAFATGQFADTANFNDGGSTVNRTSNGSEDVFITKHDPAGQLTWVRTVGGIHGEQGWDVATDSAGNVYAVGAFFSSVDFDPGSGVETVTSDGNGDGFTLKLSNNGDFKWAHQLGGSGNGTAFSIATDSDQNAYVAGYFDGSIDLDRAGSGQVEASSGSNDLLIVKIDSNGLTEWGQAIGGGGSDVARGIAVNGTDLFVVGSFSNTVDFDAANAVEERTSAGSLDMFLLRLAQTPTNIPPLVVNQSGNVDEGGTLTLSLAQLSATDVDNDNASLIYTVKTLFNNGQIRKGGVALAVNDVFTQQDIIDGLISYVHDDSNTTSDSFLFTVRDPAGAETGNEIFSAVVTPVDDDIPVVTTTNLSLTLGAITTLSTSNLSANDTDSENAGLIFTVKAMPDHGSLKENSIALAVGDTFTQRDVTEGRISYTHNGSPTIADSFDVTAKDGAGNESARTTVSVVISQQGLVTNQRSGATFATIAAAIAAAANDDVLLLGDGVYQESVVVNKPLTIRAVNVGKAIVDGGGEPDSIVLTTSDATIEGLWIRNGFQALNTKANVTYTCHRCIVSDVAAAFAVNTSGLRVGRAVITHSVVLDSGHGANINDGDSIAISNTVFDNVGFAYVIHNGNEIVGTNNLLHNVPNRTSFGQISGSIASDPGEVIADPMFVDRAAGDLRLSAGSPAIDTGIGIGLPFNGSAPDIGAYESQIFDFGDAPLPYATTIANNGASHQATGPRLGNTRDGEFNGQSSANADGDGSDEDGVMFGSIVLGALAGININLQNASSIARVDAWIDFNADGIWDHQTEKILSSEPVVPGLQTKNYVVPADAVAGTRFARVRVSSSGGLLPTGSAADGEVEDYRITIGATTGAVTINNDRATRSELTSIEVRFDGLAEVLPSDFELQKSTGEFVTGIRVSTNNSSGSTIATLTFTTDPLVITGTHPNMLPTLVNGIYDLRFKPTNQTLIDDYFRKYGDNDADDLVALNDFSAFRASFGLSFGQTGFNSAMDANRDGIISLSDFSAFRGAFGR